MKKVMIGILILIPIIVLLVVLAVGAIVAMDVYISVESVSIENADGKPIKNITVSTSELENGIFDISNYVYLKVLPEKATNKTATWSIEELRCLDAEYEAAYNYYIEHKEEPGIKEVKAAATLIDENGASVASNNTGKVSINSYCSFNLRVSAGNHFAYVRIDVVGFDVEKVSIANVTSESGSIQIGDAVRLVANYTPIDSKVNHYEWASDNEAVATIDQNGVVTAISSGTAHITHKASVYSSEESGDIKYVTSSAYEIVVEAGASSIYGSLLTTSRSALTLEEMGLDDGFEVVSGGTLVGDVLTVLGDEAVLRKGDLEFVVKRCLNDDIIIVDSELFDNRNESNNYILEVGGYPFRLQVIWADELKTDEIAGVVWTSNNNHIASVDQDGVVTAKDNGIVIITARVGVKSVNIELNVREKVAITKLATSNIYYSVGFARETVFASHRYSNFALDDTLEANSTLIIVEGEPEDQAELANFYSSYNFEVVEGKQYAHFDSVVANKLVFDGEGLEGKGKQKITVRVSAKYPKYETMPHYTTEEVSCYAVYGISVMDVFELKHASIAQKDYAHANMVATKDVNGYDVYVSSTKTMAIVLDSAIDSDGIVFDKAYIEVYGQDCKINNKGKVEKRLDALGRINLYGDLYGNNKMVHSFKELLWFDFDNNKPSYSELFHVAWSNVTVSNVHIRVNTLDEDETSFSAEDTKMLWGNCIDFEAVWDAEEEHLYDDALGNFYNPWTRNRLDNVRVEYSLLENGLKVSSIYNSNVTFDGCVIRNIAQCAIYTPVNFDVFDMPVNGERQQLAYAKFCHIGLNNIVASNMLGTLASISYDHYSIVDNKGTPRFGQTKDKYDKNGNLVEKGTIDDYIMENYVSKGLNCELTQTGFLDLYNWQAASSTHMLETGIPEANLLIQEAIEALVENHPMLDPYKYTWERTKGNPESWFHMGFISTGLSNLPASEKSYLVFKQEDGRIKHFAASELKPCGDKKVDAYVNIFRKLEFHFYLYDNTCDIKPGDVPPDGDALINHLHE